jgi:hypothetical protein
VIVFPPLQVLEIFDEKGEQITARDSYRTYALM